MTAENYDGYAHVHELMSRALKEETTEDEIKELYAAWSKTYDKVNRKFLQFKPEIFAADRRNLYLLTS
jgi:hemoglobin-like flavoprotein